MQYRVMKFKDFINEKKDSQCKPKPGDKVNFILNDKDKEKKVGFIKEYLVDGNVKITDLKGADHDLPCDLITPLEECIMEGYYGDGTPIYKISDLKRGQKYEWTSGAESLDVTYIGPAYEHPDKKPGSSLGKGFLFQFEDGKYVEVSFRAIKDMAIVNKPIDTTSVVPTDEQIVDFLKASYGEFESYEKLDDGIDVYSAGDDVPTYYSYEDISNSQSKQEEEIELTDDGFIDNDPIDHSQEVMDHYFNEFLKKHGMTAKSGTYVSGMGYRYDFPYEAKEDLDALGINWYKIDRVSNKDHKDFGKKYIEVIYKLPSKYMR